MFDVSKLIIISQQTVKSKILTEKVHKFLLL